MGIDTMGRSRKRLEEKSTALLFRIDNKTLLSLCDKFNISYDRDSEILEDVTKKEIIEEIRKIIEQFLK